MLNKNCSIKKKKLHRQNKCSNLFPSACSCYISIFAFKSKDRLLQEPFLSQTTAAHQHMLIQVLIPQDTCSHILVSGKICSIGLN